jgi:SAM-dependent methyltransferase
MSYTQNNVYLDEYSRQDNIARYTSNNAGAGIAYLLEHVYGALYASVIEKLIAQPPRSRGFRILEYGCGGGMNLMRIVALLQEHGATVETAYGTDFSPAMIEAARMEKEKHLRADLKTRIHYIVGSNETLARDLECGVGVAPTALYNTFDLIVGVNTFRYAHRSGRQQKCAQDIFNLLRPGGYSIMIDMNRQFPFFRSRVRDVLLRRKHGDNIPSLKDYDLPFCEAGFVIDTVRNFCWVPHSARPRMVSLCRTLTPILDACFPRYAMRSLVIGQKPG